MNDDTICYWSNKRKCNQQLYSNENDIFIIASCSSEREKYVEKIKDIIKEFNYNPIFAEDLEENNNLDAFCDNICSQIRASRLIITDLSASTASDGKENYSLRHSLNVYWEYGQYER